MGRKQNWAGKQVCICVAVLMVLSSLGCSLTKVESKIFDTKGDEAREHIALARELLSKGDYAASLREDEKAISLAGSSAPAAEAQFYAGLIYAHPANPAKDYGKSLMYLRKIVREYPKSVFADTAQTVISLLLASDKQNKSIERLNNTVEESKKSIERLNNIIEESKKVDIGIEQKKREKSK